MNIVNNVVTYGLPIPPNSVNFRFVVNMDAFIVLGGICGR